MANRNTLCVTQLNDFKLWLIKDDWQIQESKGTWETLRATKQGRKNPLIVYEKLSTIRGQSLVHLTVLDRDMPIVRQFLNSKN